MKDSASDGACWQVIVGLAMLRAAPTHRAELETQLPFGATVRELAAEGDWLQVEHDEDGYRGWLDRRSLRPQPPDWPRIVAKRFAGREGLGLVTTGHWVRLSLSAPVPVDEHGRVLPVGGFVWRLDDPNALEPPDPPTVAALLKRGRQLLGAPYLWGGCSALGIDCSGLTQLVARRVGVSLPRNASQQVAVGQAVDWAERRPGDLAFFAAVSDGPVTHVGLVAEDPTQILHASGAVRCDRLTAAGIVHSETGELTHHWVALRRILP